MIKDHVQVNALTYCPRYDNHSAVSSLITCPYPDLASKAFQLISTDPCKRIQ